MLTLSQILSIHADQIGSYGGAGGVRDQAGLESALGQVDLEVFGEKLHPTPALRAAALLYHVTRNHPFVDGNKRTAWAAMETWLLLEGFLLDMPDDDAYILVSRVAAGQLSKEDIAAQLEAHFVAFDF